MPGFRRVSEEELLRAWLFRVDRVDLVDPDGRPFDRFVVRHPGAVTVVPLHDDGTVSLVRQYRAAVDALVLELPAGTRDKGDEPPEATARRELAEEAGLEAGALGVPDRHVEHAGGQRPAHHDLPGDRPLGLPGPAGRRRGGLHDRRDDPPGRDRRAGGRRDAEGRDDRAWASTWPASAWPPRTASRDGDDSPGRRGVPLLARGGDGGARRAPWRPTGATSGRTRTAWRATASTPPRPATWRHTSPRCGRPTARRRWPGHSRASAAFTASWSKRASGATIPPSTCRPSR